MGYIDVATHINAAIAKAVEEGAKTDEIFAALCVQKEIWNVRLAQAIINNASAPAESD